MNIFFLIKNKIVHTLLCFVNNKKNVSFRSSPANLRRDKFNIYWILQISLFPSYTLYFLPLLQNSLGENEKEKRTCSKYLFKFTLMSSSYSSYLKSWVCNPAAAVLMTKEGRVEYGEDMPEILRYTYLI